MPIIGHLPPLPKRQKLLKAEIMTKNEINRLKQNMKNELDVDKKMKIAMQIAELKKRMCE